MEPQASVTAALFSFFFFLSSFLLLSFSSSLSSSFVSSLSVLLARVQRPYREELLKVQPTDAVAALADLNSRASDKVWLVAMFVVATESDQGR